MNGEITNAPLPLNQYPQASEWLTKLLQNSLPPIAIREEVEQLKLHIQAYLGLQQMRSPLLQTEYWFRPKEQTVRAVLPSVRQLSCACPTCGQKTIVDASKEKCPICTKQMVVRHNRTNGQAFLGCSAFPTCRGTKALSVLLLQKAAELQRVNRLSEEELRRIEI